MEVQRLTMKQTLAALGLALLLFSCQKEPSTALSTVQSRDSTVTKAKLLTWIKYNNSGDTGSTNFIYDANNRLSIIQNFKAVKSYSGNFNRIIRDNNGMIQVFVQDAGTSDSIYTQLFQLNGKYTYSIIWNTADPYKMDSTSFFYTGTNITSYIIYERDFPFGTYAPYSKREYSYDQNNNTTQEKWSDYDSSSKSFVPGYIYTYSYDQKVNPLNIGPESIIIDFMNLSGSNNVTKETIQGGSPQDTNLITYQYTYNSNNEPETNTSVANPPGYKSTLTYIYQ